MHHRDSLLVDIGTTTTDSERRAQTPSAIACEPYVDLIAEALPVAATPWPSGKTSSTITDFPARYEGVRRFVLTLRSGTPPSEDVVITTSSEEEGQTDYGEGPMVRDAQTGKYRRVR